MHTHLFKLSKLHATTVLGRNGAANKILNFEIGFVMVELLSSELVCSAILRGQVIINSQLYFTEKL